jgi:ubiquinone/menaquinone biosynthesis C-methylase UbiE
VPAPERALVLECGDGEAVLFLAREFPAARIRGVDSSLARVRALTDRVGLDPEGRVAFKQGDRHSLPYPDRFFDLVVQLDGHLVPAEAARVLRTGGHLILARSRRRRLAARGREWLLCQRLARHLIEPVQSEPSGDGNFLIARLEDRA